MTLKKYLFSENFDGDQNAHSFEQELQQKKEAARAEIFNEGRQQGYTEAQQSVEANIARQLEALNGHIQQVLQNQKAANEVMTKEIVDVARQISQVVLPVTYTEETFREVEKNIKDCLNPLHNDTQLRIQLSPANFAESCKRLETLLQDSAHQGKLHFQENPTLGPFECRIDWVDGGLERIEARIWAECEKRIEQFTHTASSGESPQTNIAAETNP